MTSPENARSRTRAVIAGIIALLLIFFPLICGCLQVEPEELPPQAGSPLPTITVSPTGSANITENVSSAPRPITITSPRQTPIFTEQDFPPEVEGAVSDFAEGKTTDTINGFLRWESTRARTNQSDASRIREQIHRIDYAVFNTTIKENISVYFGVSGEQARRIRNDSVFSENGYIIASYDPSVVYHRLANSGRDNEGYLTMCVIDFRRGSHLLFVNATEREFLIPHGGIWDVAGEETYEHLEFSADSVPRYDDIIQTKVRFISTKEHP
ncbi:MAG: ADP-ribosyltransferase [Methanoregula sp.]|jgi:hypothetical protein